MARKALEHTITTGVRTATNVNYRWTICSLVFFATTINYLDRAVISLLLNGFQQKNGPLQRGFSILEQLSEPSSLC